MPQCGADSSSVQHQRVNVPQIQASVTAFAAIVGDGSVATCGHPEFGYDSSSVQDQLQNVQQIQASIFAALPLPPSLPTDQSQPGAFPSMVVMVLPCKTS